MGADPDLVLFERHPLAFLHDNLRLGLAGMQCRHASRPSSPLALISLHTNTLSPWDGPRSGSIIVCRSAKMALASRPTHPSAFRSSNLGEVAVAAEAGLEAARTGDTVLHERFAPVVPFLNQALAHAEPVTADGGASIGTHADLREARDVMRQLLCFGTRAALRREIFAQADLQALLCRHFAPGQNNLQRATQADDARQAHGTAVDQRHAPTAAIDTEVGVFRHHPEIAPERELHAAGDGGALDGGDHRLVQLEPRGAQRPTRNVAAVAARLRSRDVELAQRIIGIERADVFEIPAGAERPARAVEHRHRRILVGIEFEKGGGQRIRALGVHGVAGLRPVVNHRPHRAIFFNSDCHRDVLLAMTIGFGSSDSLKAKARAAPPRTKSAMPHFLAHPMRVLAWLIVAACGAHADEATDTADQSKLTAGAMLMTDYIYRGISYSARHPAVAAYLDAQYGLLYGYTNFNSGKFSTSPAVEVTMAVGARPTLGSFEFDIGAAYYYYPGELGPDRSNYWEAHATVSRKLTDKITLESSLAYAPDVWQTGAWGTYAASTLTFDLP